MRPRKSTLNKELEDDAKLQIRHSARDTRRDSAIIRLRERNGLPPFDDGLPGETDNVFRLVKRILA
jgi:hypothetical protein